MKRFNYKGFTCKLQKDGYWAIYTKDEMTQPAFCRDVEFVCDTPEMCREWIDSY